AAIGQKIAHLGGGNAVKDSDVTTRSATACACYNVGPAVTIYVARGYTNSACKPGVICKERHQKRSVYSAEYVNLRTASRTRTRDDIGTAIAIDVACGNVNATLETNTIGEEVHHHPIILAVKDLDLRGPVGGPDDHIGCAVAIDIADGHSSSAAESTAKRR